MEVLREPQRPKSKHRMPGIVEAGALAIAATIKHHNPTSDLWPSYNDEYIDEKLIERPKMRPYVNTNIRPIWILSLLPIIIFATYVFKMWKSEKEKKENEDCISTPNRLAQSSSPNSSAPANLVRDSQQRKIPHQKPLSSDVTAGVQRTYDNLWDEKKNLELSNMSYECWDKISETIKRLKECNSETQTVLQSDKPSNVWCLLEVLEGQMEEFTKIVFDTVKFHTTLPVHEDKERALRHEDDVVARIVYEEFCMAFVIIRRIWNCLNIIAKKNMNQSGCGSLRLRFHSILNKIYEFLDEASSRKYYRSDAIYNSYFSSEGSSLDNMIPSRKEFFIEIREVIKFLSLPDILKNEIAKTIKEIERCNSWRRNMLPPLV